ncbi:MAG: T9SS type A sorting domain-containing protein [Candidatus Marinimicrobia bacterium]|nr:T9SS type A sorting domain-containing protein [Candidatus Neomarinimicrobiota bacterium]
MRYRILFTGLLIIHFTLLQAQNYQHSRYVISAANGTIVGGNYISTVILGEPFNNETITGGPYLMSSGFLTSVQDCAGVWGGTAWIDACGDCVGGTTGLMPCSDVISLDLIDANPSNQTFGIWINNSFNIYGFQFNITSLSDEIVITEAFGGRAAELDWEVYVGDNNLILGFALNGQAMMPGDSLLTHLRFAGFDQTTICINNLEMVGADGDILESEPGDCFEMSALLGDVNGDISVDIADVVLIVSMVLGNYDPNGYEDWASDLNDDGRQSVADIVITVCTILDCGTMRLQPVSSSSLSINDNSVAVAADGDIAGMQFEYAGEFEIIKSFLPIGWEMVQSDNTILIFSMDGTPLMDDVLFEYSGELTIKSNIIVDWFGKSITATINTTPTDYILHSAYPNPFNPVTAISYELPEAALVSLRIYDMNGREVSELVNGELSAGYHRLVWDASYQASGIYFVRMITADYTSTQKLMLVK